MTVGSANLLSPSEPSLTGVLFDLDGTLLDSAHEICNSANYILKQFSVKNYSVEEIRPLIGLPAKEIFTNAGITENINYVVEDFRKHLGETGGDPKYIYPGVIQGLNEIKRMGIPLVVATNKPTELATRVLERSGLLRFFDLVQGSDNLPNKPEPDILKTAAKKVGSALYSTWMVGDSYVDIRASKAAGCISVGVIYHQDYAQSMIVETPDFLVSSIVELKKVIEKNAKR